MVKACVISMGIIICSQHFSDHLITSVFSPHYGFNTTWKDSPKLLKTNTLCLVKREIHENEMCERHLLFIRGVPFVFDFPWLPESFLSSSCTADQSREDRWGCCSLFGCCHDHTSHEVYKTRASRGSPQKIYNFVFSSKVPIRVNVSVTFASIAWLFCFFQSTSSKSGLPCT